MDLDSSIAEYLKAYHTGEARAVTSRELETVFHIRGPCLRKAVNRLRGDGVPICSCDSGYYYAETVEELDHTIRQLFSRIKCILHPMRTRLRLFMDWGITFGEPYQMPENGQRAVYYAGRQELEETIKQRYWLGEDEPEAEKDRPRQQRRSAQKNDGPAQDNVQAGQPLATFPKKQDALPPDADGR